MSKYIELMARTLDAYSNSDIDEYISRVEKEGLTEHGFPRLAVNIGVLISHGYRVELLPTFIRMMDICCTQIPKVQAANNFTVKEIVLCFLELERTNIVPKEHILRWREQLATIDRWTAYQLVVKSRDDTTYNWALFAAVSEHMRGFIGLCDNEKEFVETQIATQMRLLDENGMYRDDPNIAPIVYDYVSRGLFVHLLALGYRGEFAREMDDALMRAGLLSLESLSALGEIPYGGRSNQFLHNDATLLITLEYERRRYKARGNLRLEQRFSETIQKVLGALEGWLKKVPVSHVKNSYDYRSGFGCEEYAYFDKYMITTASSLYTAYLISILDDVIIDDCAIPAEGYDISENTSVAVLSEGFGQAVLRAGDYSAQVSYRAKLGYDAIGLGRLHRLDAPSEICLSVPCPPKPTYSIGDVEPLPLSVLGQSIFDSDALYSEQCTLVDASIIGEEALVALSDRAMGNSVTTTYRLSPRGLVVTARGEGELAIYLPMLYSNGLELPIGEVEDKYAHLEYHGWRLEYTTNGEIFDTGDLSYNRNGVYRRLVVRGRDSLCVEITISKM